MRWASAIQVHDFSISHCSGASHQNTNELSRQECDSTDTDYLSGDPAIGKGGGDVGVSLQHYYSNKAEPYMWVTKNKVEHLCLQHCYTNKAELCVWVTENKVENLCLCNIKCNVSK